MNKGEINYYIIDHPLKAKKVAVCDENHRLEILDQFKEGMTITRRIVAPSGDQKEKQVLVETESQLVNRTEKRIDSAMALTILLLFTGVALSYLFFTPFFAVGYLPIRRFLFQNFGSLTPELVNRYTDFGTRSAALLLGIIFGVSPLLLILNVRYRAISFTRKTRRYLKLLKNLEILVM